MSSRVILDGLREFKQHLRNLPEHLKDEGGVIVEAQAQEAERRIQQAYPQGPTGNLRRRVSRDSQRSRFGASSTVRSRAQHAHIFERGTGPRRTRSGANRGSMPQGLEEERMIPIVVRRRRIMVEALKDLVRRAGFQVS